MSYALRSAILEAADGMDTAGSMSLPPKVGANELLKDVNIFFILKLEYTFYVVYIAEFLK